jgi:hypothetical protein
MLIRSSSISVFIMLHNDSQLTADGPSRSNLRENSISNIEKFSQRTTTGHLWLGAVMQRYFISNLSL